jgi:hypothetical protein
MNCVSWRAVIWLTGAPDGTAPRAGIDYGSVEPRARSPYALPPWGILVIRCEEKTVIADSAASA